MKELKEGTIVEHIYTGAVLTVKMVQGTSVVVEEAAELKVYPISELYVLPGDDYSILRRLVTDAAATVHATTSGNIGSVPVVLALTRRLYAAGVRDTDHVSRQVKLNIVANIDDAEIKDLLARMDEYKKNADSPELKPYDPAPSMPFGGFPGGIVVQHPPVDKNAGTFSDEQLAIMCCDVADMLAGAMGFTCTPVADTVRSDVCRRVSFWAHSTRNLRKSQTWEMAKKVVGHCRQAEVEDAVENVLEAIRQAADVEDDD